MGEDQACTYDGYTKLSAGANRTAGWKFTPAEDITVSAIRIKGTAAYTTKAQIWKYSDGTLVTSTDITLVDGSWVEQPITPVTLSAGTVYVVSQNVYTAYGYYGNNGVPASSFFSSKIASISDVRIDNQNVCPTVTVGWFLAIDFIIGKDNAYKTFGNAVLTSNCVQAITEYASSIIKWTEDAPNGSTVTVEAACKSVAPVEADYSACANGAALGCIADGQDCSGLTLYIRVKLTTTDTTLTPTISGIKVTVTDKKYLNFVSEPRNGVFKIYCDISAQTKGVSVSHHKNSRLHFWDGTQVPVFSEWFTVTGLASMLDAGYFYEKAQIDEVMTATENSNLVMWTPIVIPSISETANITGTDLTATENVNIVLI